MITAEEVKRRIALIDTWEEEIAHKIEDGIWKDTLRAIAEGAPNPQELARAALRTTELDFDRWYA